MMLCNCDVWICLDLPEFTRIQNSPVPCHGQGVGEKGQSIVLANGLAKLMQKGMSNRFITAVMRAIRLSLGKSCTM